MVLIAYSHYLLKIPMAQSVYIFNISFANAALILKEQGHNRYSAVVLGFVGITIAINPTAFNEKYGAYLQFFRLHIIPS